MRISVPIRPDPDGYTGRECPTCERYFKIKGGTGIRGLTVTHCPYCNHMRPHTEFWTKQQIAFARSVAMHKVSSQLLLQMKKLERRPDPRALVSIGIKVRGNPTPIRHYTEKELEERVTCSACSLEYTIYGSFGYYPDCGVHNSAQIANANFDLILKALDLAGTASEDLRTKLVENALEDAVACFDGFGREHCANQTYKISFQNLEVARAKLQREHGLDLAASLSADDWGFVTVQFQKRHLLAHTLGIIDADFIAKTSTSPALEGRKVTITDSEVRKLVSHLRVLAEALHSGLPRS